jgi:hypothetical protein
MVYSWGSYVARVTSHVKSGRKDGGWCRNSLGFNVEVLISPRQKQSIYEPIENKAGRQS